MVHGPLLQHTQKRDGALALSVGFTDSVMLTSGDQMLNANLPACHFCLSRNVHSVS